jgi:hypothetical protein
VDGFVRRLLVADEPLLPLIIRGGLCRFRGCLSLRFWCRFWFRLRTLIIGDLSRVLWILQFWFFDSRLSLLVERFLLLLPSSLNRSRKFHL